MAHVGHTGDRRQSAEHRPGSLSQLAFSWVTPLISLGARRQLQHEDLNNLPPHLQTQHCRSLMWQQWHRVRAPLTHQDGHTKKKTALVANLETQHCHSSCDSSASSGL